MKILIVNKFLHPNGGSETYIFEIGKCLQSMGHEVQYFGMEHAGRVVGNHAGIYTSDMDFHGSGLKGKLSKLTYPFKIIHSRDAARRISRVLDDFHPDVVHFNNINFQLTPSVIEAVADHDIRNRTTTRMIYTAHDSQWVCPNHLLMRPDGHRCFECNGGKYGCCIRNRCIHGNRLRSILGAYESFYYRYRKTYGLIDVIIAPSRFMKETLESDPVLKGKCTVMHNFIPGHNGADGNIRQNLRDACERKYVLYFGRFSEEKGVTVLLKSISELPDIDFVFAGSGPMEEEVNGLKNIDNVGFIKGAELEHLVKNAEFTVFPSICHENCSFTVMESISYGTPIIASNTGGTPELVENGINGLIFEAGDQNALTKTIRRLWDDREETDRLKKGCELTHYPSVEDYCDRLLEIYKTGDLDEASTEKGSGDEE